MMDVNVVFLRDGRPLSAASLQTGSGIATAEVPPQADTARIVSPGALRMRINREAELSSENGGYIVIPPATLDYWPVEHGQFLHFTGDAFGVVDSKAAQ